MTVKSLNFFLQRTQGKKKATLSNNSSRRRNRNQIKFYIIDFLFFTTYLFSLF